MDTFQGETSSDEHFDIQMELSNLKEEMEQTLYVTSHDLRSPLVNIQCFSSELASSINELNVLLHNMNADQQTKEKISFFYGNPS